MVALNRRRLGDDALGDATASRFRPASTRVRSGLAAGGGSQERTRLRNPGLFRAILEWNKLVFGVENHEESQPWLVIG